MSEQVLERVVRRESHSSRAIAAAIVLVLAIVALAWVATEIILRSLELPALLAPPGAMATWLAELPENGQAVAIVAGSVVVGLVGIACVFLALAPGRLAKQRVQNEGPAILVDNGALASAIAQGVANDLSFDRREVSVGVGHRVVDVTIRPSFGVEVDRAAVSESAARELSRIGLEREPRVRVYVVAAREKEPA